MDQLKSLENDVPNWTLASDMKLLDILRLYSINLNERTNSLIEKVEDLSSDVCTSQVKLRNTFNEFMMMSDTQFIENVRKSSRSCINVSTNSTNSVYMMMMKMLQVVKQKMRLMIYWKVLLILWS